MAYVAVKGGEQAIDNAHAWLAEERRGDPRRAGAVAGADRAASLAARSIGSMARRLAVRPGACRAGGEAGAGRPDRGGLPAARLSHHLAALRATPRRSIPPRCGSAGGSRRCSRICRAARCWARPTTTRTGCWTFRYWPRTAADAAHRSASRCRPMPRVPDILGHEGLIEPDGAGDGRARRPDARAADVSRRPRRAAAGAGARRRGVPAGTGLLHPARLRRHASVRRRDPHGRGCGGDRAAGTRLRDRYRRHHRHRMPDGEPVQGLEDRAAAIHPRLWPGVRLRRAQGDGDGAGRSRHARRGAGRGSDGAGTERRVRAVPLGQHRGDRLRRASEAAALRRFPERTGERPPDARASVATSPQEAGRGGVPPSP